MEYRSNLPPPLHKKSQGFYDYVGITHNCVKTSKFSGRACGAKIWTNIVVVKGKSMILRLKCGIFSGAPSAREKFTNLAVSKGESILSQSKMPKKARGAPEKIRHFDRARLRRAKNEWFLTSSPKFPQNRSNLPPPFIRSQKGAKGGVNWLGISLI